MKQEDKNEILTVLKRLPNYTKLIYHLYKAPFVTKRQKLLLSTAMGYLISPIELVPGFIPVVGQVDDLVIVLTILKKVLKANDNGQIQDLLYTQGITLEIIDEDIDVSMRVAKAMVTKVGKFMGKSLWWSGKASIGFAKKMIGRKKQKSNKGEKES